MGRVCRYRADVKVIYRPSKHHDIFFTSASDSGTGGHARVPALIGSVLKRLNIQRSALLDISNLSDVRRW